MTSNKKTIIFSANTSWGLYNFRKNLILSIISEGYKVIAVSAHDDYLTDLSLLGCRCINIDLDASGMNPIKDFVTIFQLYKIYKINKPSAVLHFTPKISIYSSIACSLLNIPFVTNISGLGIISLDKGFLSIFMKFLYKISQKKVSKIFFQNESDRSKFIDNKIISKNISDRLPGSGVDLDYFSLEKYEANDEVKFILIARMLYKKGILEYVSAAKKIKFLFPGVNFQLLGPSGVDNPSSIDQSTIDSWVKKGYINYLGSTKNIKKHIASADCVVLPSYYPEGVPRSLLEAGAMGKMIVTTDSVGCRDTVDDGVNGYICLPQNVQDLTNKLKKVIKMSHLQRINMGLQSRKKMEREFDERIIIKKYKQTINKITCQKS